MNNTIIQPRLGVVKQEIKVVLKYRFASDGLGYLELREHTDIPVASSHYTRQKENGAWAHEYGR
jgi:hypothetical protein